jgi:hypothetical protein
MAATISGGCAQNAILELEVVLPQLSGPDGEVFALLQPRKPEGYPFENAWAGSDLPAIPLSAVTRRVDMVSVESDDEATDLQIKITYCNSASCTELGDALRQEWFLIERPFYIGARTHVTLETSSSLPTDPPGPGAVPTVIGRCDVRGCVEGMLSDYCRMDGRHLCE